MNEPFPKIRGYVCGALLEKIGSTRIMISGCGIGSNIEYLDLAAITTLRSSEVPQLCTIAAPPARQKVVG